MELEIEVYLRHGLNLPKSAEDVQFFTSRLKDNSSGSLIRTQQSLKNADRRRAGAWIDPPGQRPAIPRRIGINAAKRSLGVPGVPPPPKDAEPLIPPATLDSNSTRRGDFKCPAPPISFRKRSCHGLRTTARNQPLRPIRGKGDDMLRPRATLRTRLIVPVLFAAGVNLSAHAQPAAPAAAASASDYSGVRYGPMQKLRCPDGEYRGPEPGKKVWAKDEYSWFVTRDFARRFCMPESMVSDDLKGAEAVAVRVKPSHETACQQEERREVCRRKAELQLELYVRSDLNLPKSAPEVDFYINRFQIESSGDLIQNNQALKNRDRIRAGKYRLPAGQIRPYSSSASTEEWRRIRFMYLNFSGPEVAIPGEDFYEQYYQANWVDGIDLIRLGPGPALGVGILSHPDTNLPSRRFGIGVIRKGDMPTESSDRLTMTRSRFALVIDLPIRISELIYAYDKQQGDLLINAAKRALGVPGTSPAPKDAEPLVPPVSRCAASVDQ